MNRTNILHLISVGLVLVAGSTGLVHGQVRAEIEPPDCYRLMAKVRGELELLRAEMGKPKDSTSLLMIKGALPREVFFQALTLFQKADRFCFQIARTSAPVPITPTGPITPGDVFKVIDAALSRLRIVKQEFEISETVLEIPREDNRTPTDVFQSIAHANRQLNLLLGQQMAPSDCFQQVTLALHHATKLRAHFPGKRMPSTPPLERRKQPVDVYERLLSCFGKIHEIAHLSGVHIAHLQYESRDFDSVSPSDVYDIASLLVAELSHLHLLLTGAVPENTSYPPGRRLPSHVCQRARLLEAQLDELIDLIRKDPGWLKSRNNK